MAIAWQDFSTCHVKPDAKRGFCMKNWTACKLLQPLQMEIALIVIWLLLVWIVVLLRKIEDRINDLENKLETFRASSSIALDTRSSGIDRLDAPAHAAGRGSVGADG